MFRMPYWDPLRGDPRFEQIVASLAPKWSIHRATGIDDASINNVGFCSVRCSPPQWSPLGQRTLQKSHSDPPIGRTRRRELRA